MTTAPNLITAARELFYKVHGEPRMGGYSRWTLRSGPDAERAMSAMEAALAALPNEADHGPLVLVPAKWVGAAASFIDEFSRRLSGSTKTTAAVLAAQLRSTLPGTDQKAGEG